jgi:hypothetical protein
MLAIRPDEKTAKLIARLWRVARPSTQLGHVDKTPP